MPLESNAMTSERDGFDRGAILARRALLISSALASFSCSTTPPAATDDGATLVTLPTADSAAPGSASVATSVLAPTDVPRLPSWKETLAKAPSREVPNTLPPAVRQMLENLNRGFEALDKSVQPLWEAGEGLCDPKLPECRAAWRALGDHLLNAHETTRQWSRSLCGGSSEPPAILARQAKQRVFLIERLDEAEAHWSKLAAAFGPLADQEWQKHVSKSKVAPPMPCLSCMAPRAWTVANVVKFPSDSAALDASGKQEVSNLLQQFKAQKRPLEVWGIALTSEKEAALVAKKRAEAVRDEMVRGGYDKAMLEVVVIGAGLNETDGVPRVEFRMKDKPFP